MGGRKCKRYHSFHQGLKEAEKEAEEVINKMKIHGIMLRLVAGALLLAMLAGCTKEAPAPTPPVTPPKPAEMTPYDKAMADWPAVEAAARKEGQVVIYGTFNDDDMKSTRDFFAQNYPEIKLQYVQGRAADTQARLKAEQASGAYIGDVVGGTGATTLVDISKWGFADFVPPEVLNPNIKWIFDPLQYRKTQNLPLIWTCLNPWGMIVNNKLLSPAEQPKSFKELADPKWKGKIIIDDPTTAGNGQFWFTFMMKMYGEDYLKKVLVDNKATLTRDRGTMPMQVARGDFLVSVASAPKDSLSVLLQPGVSDLAKFIYAQEGAGFSVLGGGVVKNAPHPNAAKLVVNFWLSQKGQEVLAKSMDGTPIRPGVNVDWPVNVEKETLMFQDQLCTPEFLQYITDMGAKAKQMVGQ